jgi:hypothetical protein
MNRMLQHQMTSRPIDKCQICSSTCLEHVLFLGFHPPVNTMSKIGERPIEQPSYPTQLLYCPKCALVQLGCIVDRSILFPPEYPYTSSTTRILRENFAELYRECSSIIDLGNNDLIVDIGSNDGNLLSNFKDNHRVMGITPEEIGKNAIQRGIPTIIDFFKEEVVKLIIENEGKAKVVTATNVFAHIDDVNMVVKNILTLMDDEGVFISESHYLLSLVETVQYDTIYHEHMRYYSLHSIKFLLEKHGLEIFHAKKIPTHGGSIRVYAARKGQREIKESVGSLLSEEKDTVVQKKHLLDFGNKVVQSKLDLYAMLAEIKRSSQKVYGIGAPSRASTLITYVGLKEDIIDCVLEIGGSYKIGKYMPGTLIPILEESKLFEDQPEYVLILSWHIANELIAVLKKKGYRGKFIIPLPTPKIVF